MTLDALVDWLPRHSGNERIPMPDASTDRPGERTGMPVARVHNESRPSRFIVRLQYVSSALLVGCLITAGCHSNQSTESQRLIEELTRAGAGIELDSNGEVEFINLSKCDVSSDQLVRLGQWKHLKKLWLDHVLLTDDQMPALATLKGLQVLVLSHTRVTDNGLSHVARLHQLKELYLVGTAVSDEAVYQLNEQIPSLQIFY